MTLKSILKSPTAWLAAVLGTIFAVKQSLILGFLTATWMNLGSLFTFASIAGLTLPRYWPPENTAELIVIAIGIAFAAKVGWNIWKTYDKEI